MGRELGLVDDARWASFMRRRAALERESARLAAAVVQPDAVPAGHRLAPLKREASAASLLRRPEVAHRDLVALDVVGHGTALDGLGAEERELTIRRLEIEAHYAGYIARQGRDIERSRDADAMRLPPDLDYGAVGGLSNEVREKLAWIRPETIGQAGRVSGMTPAAISLLLVHLKKQRLARRSA